MHYRADHPAEVAVPVAAAYSHPHPDPRLARPHGFAPRLGTRRWRGEDAKAQEKIRTIPNERIGVPLLSRGIHSIIRRERMTKERVVIVACVRASQAELVALLDR